MSGFNMYESIARSHNEAHPEGPYVTSADVRQELHRLLEIYGKFKYLQESDLTTERIFCSFCHRGHPQIHGLVAGPGGVCICYDCVDKCRMIIEDVRRPVR